ncbi:MAG: alpha-amylase family glycosyl hydrolase [Bacteroidota bacterium]
MKRISSFTLLLLSMSLLWSCKQNNGQAATEEAATTAAPKTVALAEHARDTDLPQWAVDANIYEVNLRQYTKEGTIAAFEKHLPRLKEMGVDILWFMPIHPISKAKRKGGLGSYYAVADYKDVNPEHGTLEDFKGMVQKIHELGMYIIIDWVPNHTGWDNSWITEHPDWYTQDDQGNIIDPIDPSTGESWGWTDVADLNYDNKDMRAAMIDAMRFWLTDLDIDGFRCDVAHSVPNDFWIEANRSLKQAKDGVFMLAESDVPDNVNTGGFHMDYGWPFHHLMNHIAEGKEPASAIDDYLKEDQKTYTKGFHMHFTSNHDENTWSGTEFDRMKDGHQTFAVLAATFDGMPLVYTGQESANRKRLKFFEKDFIEWKDFVYADFYQTLLHLKKKNKALWNGSYGGPLQKITTDHDESVYAFLREKGGDRVVIILNLSDQEQDLTLKGDAYAGTYNDVFEKQSITLSANMNMQLNPWDYMVLSNQ